MLFAQEIVRRSGAGMMPPLTFSLVKSAKTVSDAGPATSIERAVPIVARFAQTCERSWRVIWSIAVRPVAVVSTRAPTSPERFITISISEKVASETIIAIAIVTSSSGSVKPCLGAKAAP